MNIKSFLLFIKTNKGQHMDDGDDDVKKFIFT